MIELIEKRQENSKAFRLDDGKKQLHISIGAIHYKDNYADKSEQWKDIDLTWEGNRITKAPYELTLDGNKITIRDKRTGEVSTIELLEIGGIPIPAQAWEYSKGLAKAFDTDLEVVAENGRVRFARILKSDQAPKEAKFKVTGNIPLTVSARDAEDTLISNQLPVVWTLIDGILTETLNPDRPIKYPVRIDPTWQVGASADDCTVFWNGSAWELSLTLVGHDAGDLTVSSYFKVGTGQRFLNVTIPNGSIIDTAHLTFKVRITRSTTVVRTRIRGEDIDDAATFSDLADYQARDRTAAVVDWDGIGTWTDGEVEDSIDFKAVVQEIVDRVGWASGNDLVIFWDDHDGRSDTNNSLRGAHSWDSENANAPKLVVTYTVIEEKTGSDTGSGVDASVALSPISEGDTGSGADASVALLAALVKEDSGEGVEALGDRLFSAAEVGEGAELASLLAERIRTDTGMGSDAIISFLTSVSKLGTDSGTGVDVATLKAFFDRLDSGSGVEAILSRDIVKAESGAGLDALVGLLAELIKSDTGEGSDQGEKLLIDQILQAVDSGVGVDEAIVSCIGQLLKLRVFTRPYRDLKVYTRPYRDLRVYTDRS